MEQVGPMVGGGGNSCAVNDLDSDSSGEQSDFQYPATATTDNGFVPDLVFPRDEKYAGSDIHQFGLPIAASSADYMADSQAGRYRIVRVYCSRDDGSWRYLRFHLRLRTRNTFADRAEGHFSIAFRRSDTVLPDRTDR